MASQPVSPLVRTADADGIRTLTLANPAARNALSHPMMEALEAALGAAGADPAVRVIVLAAEGPAFCAGHDLKEMRANPDPAFHAALMARCVALLPVLESPAQKTKSLGVPLGAGSVATA